LLPDTMTVRIVRTGRVYYYVFRNGEQEPDKPKMWF
jgi:hypothetical protein